MSNGIFLLLITLPLLLIQSDFGYTYISYPLLKYFFFPLHFFKIQSSLFLDHPPSKARKSSLHYYLSHSEGELRRNRFMSFSVTLMLKFKLSKYFMVPRSGIILCGLDWLIINTDTADYHWVAQSFGLVPD